MKKMKKLLFIIPVVLMVAVFSSCSNQDIEFDDFAYQSVYFAYQSPTRTITLGEDFVDTSMDNEHKFRIMATLGGVYSNKKNVNIDFVVDNTIIDRDYLIHVNNINLGRTVKAMPANYYQLAANSITIPQGSVVGGVEVQLTDAFFADPLALATNYVIPVRMVNVQNADTILSGLPKILVTNPNRLVPDHWEVLPKDYVLYAVRFVNPWHGFYLRRGKDQITAKVENITSREVVRRTKYVETDQVMLLSSGSLNSIIMPVVLQGAGGVNISAPIRLTFDGAGNFSVSSPSDAYTATGSGSFIKRGEKNSWGNQDRDVIYMNYEIDLDVMRVATTDTLVLRNRGVSMETFPLIPIE
jgi:hypothetical protein